MPTHIRRMSWIKSSIVYLHLTHMIYLLMEYVGEEELWGRRELSSLRSLLLKRGSTGTVRFVPRGSLGDLLTRDFLLLSEEKEKDLSEEGRERRLIEHRARSS